MQRTREQRRSVSKALRQDRPCILAAFIRKCESKLWFLRYWGWKKNSDPKSIAVKWVEFAGIDVISTSALGTTGWIFWITSFISRRSWTNLHLSFCGFLIGSIGVLHGLEVSTIIPCSFKDLITGVYPGFCLLPERILEYIWPTRSWFKFDH